MEGTNLNLQQLSNQDNYQVYNALAVMKQETFIQDKIKNDSSLNGEFALNLKSPEFDLDNIATEYFIDAEQTELLSSSKSIKTLPGTVEKKVEIGREDLEANDVNDKCISINLNENDTVLNESDDFLPKIKEEKYDLGTESSEPRINTAKCADTESDEFKNFTQKDSAGLEMKVLKEENLIIDLNNDGIELNKTEEIFPRIKMEKVEIDIGNMESRNNKANGTGSDSKSFNQIELKIKVSDGGNSMKYLKKVDLQLQQIESIKTEANLVIKEEVVFEPGGSLSDKNLSNSVQNQNVRFNILNRNRNFNNNSCKIKLNCKSKSDKNSKKKIHVSKNKHLDSKTTQVSSDKFKMDSGNFECPYCGYKCKYDAIYQDHLLSHVNSLHMYSCRICNFRGKSNQQYMAHMLAGHEESKMLKCVSCKYINTCENQFRLHLTEKGHKVICPKCSLEFESTGDLKRHLMEHETKVYECSVCKKLMKYKQLKSHLLTHTSAFECKECGYKTNGNKRLKDHMKVHTKEKPYKCQMCTKSFRLENGLKTHMLSHQNRESRKLYECNVCKKTYLSHQALKLHFKKKNHGTDTLSVEVEGIGVKRTKIRPKAF